MDIENGLESFWNGPPAHVLHPGAPDFAAQLESVPRSPGVYALRVNTAVTHLSWSANLPKRLGRLLLKPPPSGISIRDRFRDSAASVHCWPTSSKLETSLLLYRLARANFSNDYLRRLHLRLPWFVGLSNANRFPRLIVANRASNRHRAVIGPFPTRDTAQLYEQELLGFFQIRRCSETLQPHPDHPGCIYGEMNQCLRPCQCAVTDQEYSSEVIRVADFLITNGKSAISVLAAARDRASDQMDFEQAAHVHNRIEKVQACAGLRDVAIAEVEQFHGVALTRGATAHEFRLWPMFAGMWQAPLTLGVALENTGTRSLDQTVRQELESVLAHPRTAGNRTEELAIFSRWYYSSWRDGTWYAFRSAADLNYRRLVREISKLAREA